MRAGPRPEGIVRLEAAVLGKNDQLAKANRADFEARKVAALNVMSSPGSGKTTLLVRTIEDLGEELPFYVLEGDQETAFDAERIRATGTRALQINTGKGCHLEADMVAQATKTLDPEQGVLLIENVGNLVCPALFDLGEKARIVLFSVTEGKISPKSIPTCSRPPTSSSSPRPISSRISTSTDDEPCSSCVISPRTPKSSNCPPRPAKACRSGTHISASRYLSSAARHEPRVMHMRSSNLVVFGP